MAKGNSREIGNNLLKGAFAGLVMWLLYIANKDDVEMFDLKINIELFNKWSTNGIFSFLGKVSLFAAIVNVIGALVYYSRYSNAPEVLCPACSLTYRDEVGDGVCPYCGKNRNDFKKTDSAQIPKWLCSCGAVHPGYVSSCSCGKNKREGTMVEPQSQPKRTTFSTAVGFNAAKQAKAQNMWDHWNEEHSSIGRCEVCGAKGQFVVFAEFQENDQTFQKNLCFECFSHRECKPVIDK